MDNDNDERKVPEGYVILISGDGHEFYVEEEYASASKVIKMMLNSKFKESRTRVINLPQAKAPILEKVCQYFYYKPRYKTRARLSRNSYHPPTESAHSTASDTLLDGFEIPHEMSIELAVFASYLDL